MAVSSTDTSSDPKQPSLLENKAIMRSYPR
jgi:hypothetical protein